MFKGSRTNSQVQSISSGSGAKIGGAVRDSMRGAPADSAINRISVTTRRVFAIDLSSRVGDVIPVLCKQFNHQKEASSFTLLDTEAKKVLNPGRSLAAQGVNDSTPLELVESGMVPSDYARVRDFATRKASFAAMKESKSSGSDPQETLKLIETVRADAHARAHSISDPSSIMGQPSGSVSQNSPARKKGRKSLSNVSFQPPESSSSSSPTSLMSSSSQGDLNSLHVNTAPGKALKRKESKAVVKALKTEQDLPPSDIPVYLFARSSNLNVHISPSSSYYALTKKLMKDRKVKGEPSEFGIWLHDLTDDSGANLAGDWAMNDHPINSNDLRTTLLVFMRRNRKIDVFVQAENRDLELPYTSETRVSDVFRAATGRELSPSHDMAIFLPEGEIMDKDRPVWSYRISGRCIIKMKERPLAVFFAEGLQKNFSVDYSEKLGSLMKTICFDLQIPSMDNINVVSLHGRQTPLELEKSLIEQDITPAASLMLKSKKKGRTPNKSELLGDSDPAVEGEDIWKDLSKEKVNNRGERIEVGILYEQNDASKPATQRQILAASLNKLIERLSSETSDSHDLEFAGTFFLTYQSFTTTRVILKKLMQRYSVPEHYPPDRKQFVQMKVLSVLVFWLEKHFAQDLTHDLLQMLVDWIDDTVIKDGNELLANNLRHAIVQRTCGLKREKKAGVTIGKKIPEPMIPKEATTMWDYPPEEVARQITLIDFDYYFEIRPTELLNQNWNKKKELAPNVETQISRMNQLGMWATNSILEPTAPSQRARRWVKLINIALWLRKLHNFNTIAALLGGMQNASINRLKKTISNVPKKKLEEMQELNDLMSPNGSYKNLRSALANSSLPCIPFLGMYLRDLTFIEDGNQDNTDGLINWEKRTFLHNIIAEVQKYQRISYSFIRVQKLADTFIWLPTLSDKMLYEISLLREPRDK